MAMLERVRETHCCAGKTLQTGLALLRSSLTTLFAGLPILAARAERLAPEDFLPIILVLADGEQSFLKTRLYNR